MGIDWEDILDADGDDMQDAYEDSIAEAEEYFECDDYEDNNYDED